MDLSHSFTSLPFENCRKPPQPHKFQKRVLFKFLPWPFICCLPTTVNATYFYLQTFLLVIWVSCLFKKVLSVWRAETLDPFS